jgi:potassium efflux system protein
MSRLYALIFCCFSAFWAVAVVAQNDVDSVDYKAWKSTAARIEQALDEGQASNKAMESMRVELVDFRKQFLAAETVNAARIKTLQAQLEALGPVPETGEEHVVAARRTDLKNQLSLLQTPVVVAEEAYSLADALIREIDKTFRERQRADFLERGPTPLNFSKWPLALDHVVRSLKPIGHEMTDALNNPTRMAQFQNRLPSAVALVLVAIVLIARGRRWSYRLGQRIQGVAKEGVHFWNFVFSLGGVLLPMIGLSALALALSMSGLLGLRGTVLVNNFAIWGAILLIFRWLCERVFSKHDEEALINLSSAQRAEARFYGTALALLIVLRSFAEMMVKFEAFSPQISAIVFFPQVLLAGLIFFRLGHILRDVPLPQQDTESAEILPRSSSARGARAMGTLMMLIGVATPIMSALGYDAASKGIIFPMIGTFGVLGLLLILNRLFGDVYGWISGKGTEGRDALISVLFGFVLVLSSMPFLALFWGARVADLAEWWHSFLAGFSFGGVTVSPVGFLTFAAVFSAGYMITRVLQGTLRSNLLPKTNIDPGGQNAIVSGLGYIGIFLAAIVAISFAGIDLSSIAIVAGALSVGIGFGLQTIVSNFVSGIILLIERPISEGDWIEVGGHMGYVRDISVRATRIETFDRTDVIVPNSDLVSGTVTNFTRGNTIGRVIVKVGVAYGTDTKRVEGILSEIANAHPMILANPKPNIVLQAFGSDALEFEIRAILRDVNWVLNVKSDINHEIAKRFEAEGISIPFAQRDIWLRNPEALKPSSEPA